MNLTLITAPVLQPITYSDASMAIGLLGCEIEDDDRLYIESLIRAATEYCEAYQNKAYIEQVWEMTLDAFPYYEITLPKGNLQTVDTFTWKSNAGVTTTLTENTDYYVSTKGLLGRIVPVEDWTSDELFPLDAISITFTCGKATIDSVPEKVKQAIRLLVAHWYDHRTPIDDTRTAPQEIAFTLSALLDIDRMVLI